MRHARPPIAIACAALLGLASALSQTGPAGAAADEKAIAALGGPELTPIGATRAGNAEGTIPEWSGGVSEAPEGWRPGQTRIDLFARDPVLFSIDASNLDEHRDRLTAGQVALIESYEGYRMDVYASRRSCAMPQSAYERTRRNAREASVDEECNLTGGVGSPLFPFPENGCQAIQNGRTSVFNGMLGYERTEATIVPTKAGSFVPIRRRQSLFFKANNPALGSFEALEGIWTKSLSHTTAPAKLAGEITLVHSLADGHLKAWIYNPGQRRVRRAPNFEYDNPVPGWQGLVTVDQVNGFVGAADRYDWKLLGKQELYIPYNNSRIHDKSLSYKDIVGTRYPRRDLLRYELHRVWKVEATVRDGKRHVMPRRVFYMDEDSWIIVAVDNYDSRGNLWRVSEHLPELLYELPSCGSNASIYYDLVAGRYVISPIYNEEGESDYLAGHTGRVKDSGFSPDDIRRMGRR